nr:hypothetical protein GCM10020093_046330 [Planobispora longispora]
MVNYVVQRHNGDSARVFATGFSSGAMETVNLLATYPDVFKAGAPSPVCPSAASAHPVAATGHRSSGATWSATPTRATPVPGPG